MGTIRCSNPNCQAIIEVPEGALEVMCPSCNTWHFPSISSSSSEEIGLTPPVDDYAPPIFNDNQELDNNRGAALPGSGLGETPPYYANDLPPEVPSSIPDSEPTFTPLPIDSSPKEEEAPQEEIPAIIPIGKIVTIDGNEFPLKEGRNIIGRKDTDIIINDKTVSRRHCVIEVNKSSMGSEWEYSVYDIGHIEGTESTNGVFTSHRSLRLDRNERIAIGNGTTILLGNVQLVLKFN